MTRNKNAAAINPDTFREWTNENVWALGLFTADGSISGDSRPNEFKIYSTEIEMLEVFRGVFESDKKIYVTKGCKGRLGKKPVGMLQMSNKKIADFFKSVNAYGDKESRNPFNYVPEEFKWSFVKGLFDGDGNCYRGQFSIAGRRGLIGEVYRWICEQINKEPNKIYNCSSTDVTVYFQLSKGDAERVFWLMEKHCEGTYNSDKYKKLESFYVVGDGLDLL